MSARRAMRLALPVVVVAAVALALRDHAADLGPALGQMSLGWVAVAAAFGIAGVACTMFAWRALLADLGSSLPLRPVARVFFLGQLGKYVPGSIWAVVAQMELGRAYAVPRKRVGAATLLSFGIGIVAGALVASSAVLVAPDLLRKYWWALVALPVGLVVLHPPVFGWAIDRGLRLLRREPLDSALSRAGELRSLAWYVASWVLLGLQVWALARGLGATGTTVLPLSVAGFALAWTAGFLVVFVPAGAGVREAVLVVALSSVLDEPAALALALVSRALLTLTDVGLAGFAAVLPHSRR